MTDASPPGYVRFERVRESLPDPEYVRVAEGVELEAVHAPGADPAFVFVHGGLGSLWNPFPQLQALDGDRELVTYSLAGNRNSSGRPEQSVDGHVADLQNLLDELGVNRPVVHGHSLGSGVAVEYAKRHEVAGLVVAGGGDHDLTAWWEPLLLAPVLALRLYRLPLGHGLARRFVSAGCHPDTSDRVVADFARANPLPRRRSAWRMPRAFRDYDGRSDARRIDAPTLVVHGAADDVVPREVARATADRIPGAAFRLVDRAGHFPFVERPAAYADLLRAVGEAARTGRDVESTIARLAGDREVVRE